MAVLAHNTGAPKRASILDAVLARFDAAAGAPATPLRLPRSNRVWLGDMIETLISVLDHADGDPDLEHDDRDLAADDGCGTINDPASNPSWETAA